MVMADDPALRRTDSICLGCYAIKLLFCSIRVDSKLIDSSGGGVSNGNRGAAAFFKMTDQENTSGQGSQPQAPVVIRQGGKDWEPLWRH
jgi:hypothetical protein